MRLQSHPPTISLLERLSEPKPTVPLADYAALWRQAEVRAAFSPPAGFSLDDSLAQRIRGALGQALQRAAADDRRAAEALDLLYVDDAPWRRAFPDLPRPFAMAAGRKGNAGIVRIRLFGFAQTLAPVVAPCLDAALQGGIALGEGVRVRAPIAATSLTIDRRRGVSVRLNTARWACAVFQSPLAVMQGSRTLLNADNVAQALARRVERMAPWQDLRLEAGVCQHTVGEFEWRLIERSSARQAWNSGRQHRGGLIMEGERATLVGQGKSADLEALLRLSEHTHVGARTAFGFGAMRAFVV